MGEADDSTGSPKVQLIRAVAATILESDGKLDPDLRSAAFHHGASLAGRSVALTFTLPEPLADFVDKVAKHAYKVLDADIDSLRAAGYSEDAILEAVLAAAVGSGVSRLEVGLAALNGKG